MSCFALFFFNCKKESPVPDSTPITQEISIDPQYENKLKSLVKSYAIGLLELSKNQSFRELVKNQADLEFDGDHNALFRQIYSSAQSLNINLIDSLKQSVLMHKDHIINSESAINTLNQGIGVYTDNTLLQGINGFKYYEDTLYLHLFIPRICPQEISQRPTLVMVYDDVDVTDGLKFNGTSWEHVVVDSNYAKTNLCWVIAINESVDNFGGLGNENNNTFSQDGNSSVETRGACAKAIKFKQIKVTDLKEGFWGGDGDMYMIVQRITNGCIYPLGLRDGTQLFKNSKIKKVNTWCEVGFNKQVGTNLIFSNSTTTKNKFLENNELAGWIIYEQDDYKKYNKELAIPYCPDKYQYRSKQSPFGVESFYSFYGCLPDNQWYDQGNWSYPEGHEINLLVKQVN